MTMAAAAAPASSATAVPHRPGGLGWRAAQEITGTGPLGSGVQGGGPFLSCPAAGHCVVAGTGSSKVHFVPFVARQTSEGWGRARPVPGITALDGGTSAFLFALSCGAAGDCVVGGDYFTMKPQRHLLPFVAVERHGRWRRAVELPGMAALNAGMEASVTAVSCPAAGDCLAGGLYQKASGHSVLPFVVRMVGGRWRPPIELPGWGAVSSGGFAEVSSISCGSARSCAASPGGRFVANLVRGSWQNVIELPGRLPSPGINALSCASTGACAAGGAFGNNAEQFGAFVASEPHGTWGAVRQVRGTSDATLAAVTSVFCWPHGCVAGGELQPGSLPNAFVVRQTGSTWGSATILPGIERLDRHTASGLAALSCGTTGTCVAAGTYSTSLKTLRQLIFVATEVHGTWRPASNLPGIATLATKHFADVTEASCPAVGPCAVAGTVQLRKGGLRAFVAVQR